MSSKSIVVDRPLELVDFAEDNAALVKLYRSFLPLPETKLRTPIVKASGDAVGTARTRGARLTSTIHKYDRYRHNNAMNTKQAHEIVAYKENIQAALMIAANSSDIGLAP
jgi:hypothetical protein